MGKRADEATFEVLEGSSLTTTYAVSGLTIFAEDEDREGEGDDEDMDGSNPLVDTLFEEIDSLRLQASVIGYPFSLYPLAKSWRNSYSKPK